MMSVSRSPDVQDGSLLLYCLGIRSGREADYPTPPEITATEWVEILRQAWENGVAPLLYHRLRTIVPAPRLPTRSLDALAATALRSAAESLRIEHELGQVLEILRARGIATIVLKGGHLRQAVYESFALRTMCDLDIMVQREDLGRTTAALAEKGYRPQAAGPQEMDHPVDYSHHHHLRPVARPGGTRLEVHWGLVQPSSPFDIDLKGIWSRAQPARIAGVDALVLSSEDLLLHLCLHASFSHKFRMGLRACWDVSELIRRDGGSLDWHLLVQRAHQWGAGRYVYVTLRLVHEMLGVDVPTPALRALEPPDFPPEVVDWARTSIFASETDARVSPSMARLWTSRHLRARLGLLRLTLLPSRATLARIYRLRAGSRFVPIYYLVRWADLLLRYGRRVWSLWRGDDRTRDDLQAVSRRAALHDWLRSAP